MVSESRVVTASDELHESRLKMRLVGAAVLIALAVIFLPLVFDGAGTESQFRSIESIEMEPPHDLEIFDENKAVELSESTRFAFNDSKVRESAANQFNQIDGVVLDSSKKNPASTGIAETNRTAKPANPIEGEAVVPVTGSPAVKSGVNSVEAGKNTASRQQHTLDNSVWLVQTASFRDKINALSLRSDLKSAGYPVDVKVGEKDGRSIFRVYIGPVKGKAAAKKIQAALKQKFDRETLLVKQ